MSLQNYISTQMPIIEVGDDLSTVYGLLEEYENLPILEAGKYLGIITLNQFSNITRDEEGTLTLDNEQLYRPVLQVDQFPIDAIRLLQALPLDFIPITDDESNYLGVWDGSSIQQYYLASEGLSSDGATVVLEIEPRNYSLSEIAQICESANKKVLGIDLHTFPQNDTLIISLYLEEHNIGDLISALERYGYNIYHTIGYQDNQDKIKENYDVLMSYLDI